MVHTWDRTNPLLPPSHVRGTTTEVTVDQPRTEYSTEETTRRTVGHRCLGMYSNEEKQLRSFSRQVPGPGWQVQRTDKFKKTPLPPSPYHPGVSSLTVPPC